MVPEEILVGELEHQVRLTDIALEFVEGCVAEKHPVRRYSPAAVYLAVEVGPIGRGVAWIITSGVFSNLRVIPEEGRAGTRGPQARDWRSTKKALHGLAGR